jgi:Phosphoesterase family
VLHSRLDASYQQHGSGGADGQALVRRPPSLQVLGQCVSFVILIPSAILTLEHSVLIINFDEHGGFADHVPTPLNVPQPEDGIIFKGKSSNHNFTYDFTRLGVRHAS